MAVGKMFKAPKLTKAQLRQKFRLEKSFMKTCMRVMFGHIGLLLIVCAYAVGGAYILIYIELPGENYKFEQKKIAYNDLEDAANYIINNAWYQTSQGHGKVHFVEMMRKNIDLYHRFVVSKAIDKNVKYDGHNDTWDYDWTFTKSLLFTVTTIGTIGYGHIAPQTSKGQIFTVYYAMIGVPLFLLFLANIGDFLANSFRYIYSRLCCRLCRIRRRQSELTEKEKLKPRVLWKDEIGLESYMPTSMVDVPIVVNLCVIFIYLMMGGALFSFWENWTLVEAIYFSFITLSTIGFGDYVPGNSIAAGGNPLTAILKMLVTIVYCTLGMALLSMAISLMQEQMVSKFRWLASELGIGKEDEESQEKYVVKMSEEGSVTTTPQDRDGNKNKSYLLHNVEEDLLKLKRKNVQHYESF